MIKGRIFHFKFFILKMKVGQNKIEKLKTEMDIIVIYLLKVIYLVASDNSKY